jgi:hypothetical protein
MCGRFRGRETVWNCNCRRGQHGRLCQLHLGTLVTSQLWRIERACSDVVNPAPCGDEPHLSRESATYSFIYANDAVRFAHQHPTRTKGLWYPKTDMRTSLLLDLCFEKG